MKKIFKIIKIVIIAILLVAFITYLCILINNKIRSNNIKNKDWLNENINIINDDVMGDNVMYISAKDYVSIFNKNYQKVIDEKINKLLEENDYTFEKPLIIYNPYGTNTLSVNIYFTSDNSEIINYNVSVDDENINDFSRDLVVKDTKSYQLIGLVPGYDNNITLKTTENGEEVISKFTVNLCSLENLSETILTSEDGNLENELSEGLYAILGNDSDKEDYVSIYDNNGIIRGEMPIIGYRAHAILFNEDKMYLSISQTKIAEINNLGKITNIYKTGKYYLHHDYTFDSDGNILVLANNTEKDTEEDCIIKIDIKTKKVTEVIDFENMFKSYVKTCKLDTQSVRDEGEDGLDWLHLNSIEYVDGDLILSSRETSSIIKVKDINTNPKLEYILSSSKIWENTEFKDYVYTQKSDFKIHAGQHSINYKELEEEGKYYLIFYNNNYGKANSQPDFDYSTIGITNDNAFNGDESYYYVYKVDENEKTFDLIDSFPVEYSGIVSSVQTLDNNNILIDSGTKGIFAEYTDNHDLIRKFTVKLNKYMVYRVLKYDFNGYWFTK